MKHSMLSSENRHNIHLLRGQRRSKSREVALMMNLPLKKVTALPEF